MGGGHTALTAQNHEGGDGCGTCDGGHGNGDDYGARLFAALKDLCGTAKNHLDGNQEENHSSCNAKRWLGNTEESKDLASGEQEYEENEQCESCFPKERAAECRIVQFTEQGNHERQVAEGIYHEEEQNKDFQKAHIMKIATKRARIR